MPVQTNPLAWVYISEETSPSNNFVDNIKVVPTGCNTVVQFYTCLQSFDVMNRNSRYYIGNNIYNECIMRDEEIQTMLHGRRWFGEADHPDAYIKGEQLTPKRLTKIFMQNRSHVIVNPVLEGNRLNSVVESACNDVGLGFRDEVLRGMIPAFSLRAIARMEEINHKPTVVARKVVTYDWVLYPSHREAEMKEGSVSERPIHLAVTESAESPIVKKNYDQCIPIVDILKKMSEHDANMGTIMESFGLDENDIVGYDSALERAVIKDGPNKILSRLSKRSIHELHDLLSSF